MLSHNQIARGNGWCYLLTVLMSILMLVSCVPTTFDTAGTTRINPRDGYTEIKELTDTLSANSEPATAETLIEKSRTFIKSHPRFHAIGEVYYILGTTLIQFDRTEEGITVLEELVRDYRVAPSVEPSLLELGLAYDKVSQHSKANEFYDKLANNSRYSSGDYAKTARRLLQTDTSQRKGEREGVVKGGSTTNFVGQAALDFQVKDLNGQPLSLEKYRGQVVLLDFWATWCPPCIAEMPNLKRTYAKYKNQKFEIIGISLDRSKSSLQAYLEEEGITWPQHYDSSRQISNMYQVTGIPSTFLIDAEGVIRKTNLRGSSLETAVAQLVQENMDR